MPFDFKKYDLKCSTMSVHELQHEWEHYTRLISSAATSTSMSGLALPFTAGISGIGIALSAPAIHNARKKREIIDNHLTRLGATHDTRKRDVFAPMAISSTVGILTMGVGHASSGAISNAAFEHGWAAVAAHEGTVKVTTDLALHGAAMAGEEEHMKNKKEKEAARKGALLTPIPSSLDWTKLNTDTDKVAATAEASLSTGQSAATSRMGKPALLTIPAMGLSHSVPSSPMDPAPAYTEYAEAAQTGYFPPLPGQDKPVPATQMDYKPAEKAAIPPPITPSLFDEKSKVEITINDVHSNRVTDSIKC